VGNDNGDEHNPTILYPLPTIPRQVNRSMYDVAKLVNHTRGDHETWSETFVNRTRAINVHAAIKILHTLLQCPHTLHSPPCSVDVLKTLFLVPAPQPFTQKFNSNLF
jgi:hypothetical protein